MAWNYDTALTSNKDKVRRLIGDVISTDQQFQDEEIAFYLTQSSNDIYGAAANACRGLAAYYARQADITIESVSLSNSQRQKAYLDLAKNIEAQKSSTAIYNAVPYVGGTRISDMEKNENNNDRVPPAFKVGMDDNPPVRRGSERRFNNDS